MRKFVIFNKSDIQSIRAKHFVRKSNLKAQQQYRSADKSLTRPGRKQATATKL